jgi:nucleotide-binding universal stress UspA family protein
MSGVPDSLHSAWHAPDKFRSVFVPIDLSPGSERVLDRAALLPLAKTGRLTLLHVVPTGIPVESRAAAESDARRAMTAALKRVGSKLPKRLVVRQLVKVGTPAVEIAKYAARAKAELVVMGRGGGRVVQDVFLGSTAERVIRKGQLPVLVVRMPARAPYYRPLLAMDLDPVVEDVLAVLLRVVPPPRPSMTWVHAYEAPYVGMIYPSLEATKAAEYREHFRQKALHDMARLLSKALAGVKVTHADEWAWKSIVRHGTPRAVIPQTAASLKADLLVLGTKGRSGVAHALLGSVAGDVLRQVGCDVLVVPPRHRRKS